MEKKDYKKGMADAMEGYITFGKKQEAATEHLAEQVGKTADDIEKIGDKVGEVADYITSKEKAELYNLNTPVDVADLDDAEKRTLLAVLYQLCANENDVTEAQKNYIRAIQQYLKISNPQTEINLNVVENIEDIASQKAILQTVLEFFQLGLHPESVTEAQEEFLEHFQVNLRTCQKITEHINTIVKTVGLEGLIEKYGFVPDADNDESDKPKNLKYLNVAEKENIEINSECAQIYFKDCFVYDEGMQYIESSSYIIYSKDNKIMRLHKITGKQDILLSQIKNASDFIKKKKITTFVDMGYYVDKNDLYYIDLDSLDSGLIFHINEEINSDNELCEITGLTIYKAQKLIYKNGANYIVDLEKGMESVQSFSVGSETGNYFLRGDHLYFVDSAPDLVDSFPKVSYVIKRYGILNNQTTCVSKPFGKHNMFDSIQAIYEVVSEGMYGKYYYCIFGYKGVSSIERVGFDCFCVDTNSGNSAEAHNFYIWSSHIYQFEQYRQNIVYINADKDFSLVSHDFISDKKKVLMKKCGMQEKSKLSERLLCGKETFQKPSKFMRLGPWIWICKSGKLSPQIITLEQFQ